MSTRQVPIAQNVFPFRIYIRGLNNSIKELFDRSASQPDRESLEQALKDLCSDDCRLLGNVISYLCDESKNDQGRYLAECAMLFFKLYDEIALDCTKHSRRFYLCRLLDHLFNDPIYPTEFIKILDLFLEQTDKMSIDDLLAVCDTVTEKTKEEIDFPINTQWRDCVNVIVRRLLERTTVDHTNQNGAELAASLLGKWLRECKSPSLFVKIATIIEECGAAHVLRAFIQRAQKANEVEVPRDETKKPTATQMGAEPLPSPGNQADESVVILDDDSSRGLAQKRRHSSTTVTTTVSRQTSPDQPSSSSSSKRSSNSPRDEESSSDESSSTSSSRSLRAITPSTSTSRVASPAKAKKGRVYKCRTCRETFSSGLESKKHKDFVHRFFKCSICGNQFGTKGSLTVHIRSMHPHS